MTTYLFYLSDSRFGGWVSYTLHLRQALRACGHEAHIVRIGAKTEAKLRPFAEGAFYQNMSLQDALSVRGLIAAAQFKRYQREAQALLAAGNALTIHDPTEFDAAALETLRKRKPPVFTIRRAVHKALEERGIASRFVLHPYVRKHAAAGVCNGKREVNAVTLSRLDFDKNIHLIAEANRLGAGIQIFGEPNRMYIHHKLSKDYPDWDKHYRGRFASAFQLARKARYVVDMSTIAGDGGGTQYTFLEAWDAGAALVVNRKWLRADDPTLRPGENVLAAEAGADLAAIVAQEPGKGLLEAGTALLAQHAPQAVVPAYQDVLKKL